MHSRISITKKKKIKTELSYCKYPARKILRAVSEPNLQTVQVLGTTFLRKSNSFHELCGTESRNKRVSVESLFKFKLITCPECNVTALIIQKPTTI